MISAIRAQLPVPQWLVPLELVKRFLVRVTQQRIRWLGGWWNKPQKWHPKFGRGISSGFLEGIYLWLDTKTEDPGKTNQDVMGGIWSYESYGPEVFDLFNMDAKLLHTPSALIGRSKTQARISKSLLSGPQSRLQFRRIITSSEKKPEKKMLPLEIWNHGFPQDGSDRDPTKFCDYDVSNHLPESESFGPIWNHFPHTSN